MKHIKDADLKARMGIYLQNPSFWREKLVGKISQRDIDILKEYLESRLSLGQVGEKFGVGDSRVAQIVRRALYRIFRMHTVGKITPEVVDTPLVEEEKIEEIEPSPFRNSPTKEELVAMYKLRQQGVGVGMIAKEMGLGIPVVYFRFSYLRKYLIGKKTTAGVYLDAANEIKKLEKLNEEIQELSQVASPNRVFEKPQAPRVELSLPPNQPNELRQGDRYEKLDEAFETFKKSILDFIAEEIKQRSFSQEVKERLSSEEQRPPEQKVEDVPFPQQVDDLGVKGYFLEDVERYLSSIGVDKNQFYDYQKGKEGRIIDGKYFVLENTFREFIDNLPK